MEDTGKKKKFSFLASLGMKSDPKSPVMDETASADASKKNEFYVGNVQDELKKKKKMLAEIE